MSNWSNTLELVKLRQKEAYYSGMIDGVDEMSKHLNEQYFKDNTTPQDAVYELSEILYAYYVGYLEETQEEVYKLQQGENEDG
jgi:hypothetical protein